MLLRIRRCMPARLFALPWSAPKDLSARGELIAQPFSRFPELLADQPVSKGPKTRDIIDLPPDSILNSSLSQAIHSAAMARAHPQTPANQTSL